MLLTLVVDILIEHWSLFIRYASLIHRVLLPARSHHHLIFLLHVIHGHYSRPCGSLLCTVFHHDFTAHNRLVESALFSLRPWSISLLLSLFYHRILVWRNGATSIALIWRSLCPFTIVGVEICRWVIHALDNLVLFLNTFPPVLKMIIIYQSSLTGLTITNLFREVNYR